eukprot:TRINITY_DN20864_c0_g1_i1.p1 TRINITY_DN20864_c0_g1~~TRINITY_DN20864_c0_g1_i1.p1  ORF type:complete len:980 (+),score=166.64 TRINITY_DN20864_c0_g1_i1:80-3019(+)
MSEVAGAPWSPPVLGSETGQVITEAELQAQLSASEAHFGRAAYAEAFDALAQVHEALASGPSPPSWSWVDQLLRACFEQAAAHRGASNLPLAVELLMLALAATTAAARGRNSAGANGGSHGDCAKKDESTVGGGNDVGMAAAVTVGARGGDGAVDGMASLPSARARLLRQLALCHSLAGSRGLALICAREATVFPSDWRDSVDCALSFQVRLRILLETQPEAGMQTASRKEDNAPVHEARDCCADSGGVAETPRTEVREAAETIGEFGLDEETRVVALSLMRQAGASVAVCLASCDLLLRRDNTEDFVFTCLSELAARLDKAIVHGNHDGSAKLGRVEVLRFRLRLTSRRVAAEDPGVASGDTGCRLNDVLVEAERLVTCSSETYTCMRQDFASVARESLVGLASIARDKGKLLAAALWLRRSVPFLATSAELADCWAACAAYLWHADHRSDARSCAEQALSFDDGHLQAALVALMGRAELPGDADAWAVFDLMERAERHPGFTLEHAACISKALLNHPQQGLVFAGLEVLARCFLKQSVHGVAAEIKHQQDFVDSGVPKELASSNGLCIAAELAERAAFHGRPDADMLHYLSLASNLLAEPERRSRVARGLAEDGKLAGAADVGRIFTVAWARGQALGREGKWASSASVFDALSSFLENFNSVETRSMLESRAWCLALAASAWAQHSKEMVPKDPSSITHAELREKALRCIDGAHQLYRRALRAPASAVVDNGVSDGGCGARPGSPACESRKAKVDGRGIPVLAEAQAAAAKDREKDLSCSHPRGQGQIFPALVLLEFEVRCLAGEPEPQLRQFAMEASSQEAVGPKSLLAMSKISLASGAGRSLALLCLQQYLRVSVGAHGTADYTQIASAYREMISLHASRNESYTVYEGILNLLGGGPESSMKVAAIGADRVPQELAWLVSTAWNNGVHFCCLQQYRWAEKWLSISLALLRFCPGSFPEEEMRDSYAKCLQRVSD